MGASLRSRRVLLGCTAAGLLLVAASPLRADSALTRERVVTELVPGVWTIRHRDPFPGWVHSNTTVVVGERDVLVVDSCQYSVAAREDIAQIRGWTDKPVRYLVNTHWHQDHNGGNHAYLQAFPGLAILAHRETKAVLDGAHHMLPDAVRKQGPQALAQLEQALASGKGAGGKPLSEATRRAAEAQVAQAPDVFREADEFVYQAPTLTFDGGVTIDLGGRTVELLHLGRGNTGGDVVVWLPQEKIVAAGDLVAHPVPFMFDGYPAEWVVTLARLADLAPAVIVPGHGEVLRGTDYVSRLRDLLSGIVTAVRAQVLRDHELSLADLKGKLDFKAARDRLLAGDAASGPLLDYSLASFVELAYHEAKQR